VLLQTGHGCTGVSHRDDHPGRNGPLARQFAGCVNTNGGTVCEVPPLEGYTDLAAQIVAFNAALVNFAATNNLCCDE
jgi:hypothetical protein